MDIEKELKRLAAALLKRPATRRGPFVITDAELRRQS